MDCFWDRGYASTSIRNLSDATGLALPSLYNAFGDKSKLFRSALDRYFDRNTRPRLERLSASSTPLKAIRRFFSDLVERTICDPDRRGCLLINSAVELASFDDDVSPVIRDYLTRIEGFFLQALRAAQATGDLPGSASPRDLARMLLSAIIGIRVLARSRPERELLEGIVRTAMAALVFRSERRPSR